MAAVVTPGPSRDGRRRTLFIVLLAIVAAGVSVALATVPRLLAHTPPRQTVTLWLTAGLGRVLKAMEVTIHDFQASQTEYGVDLTLVPEGTYLHAIDVAGRTGDLPCLMFVDGPTIAHFAWLGYLQPLDRFLSKELRDDFLPSVLAQGTYKDRLYALGVYDSGLGIFANRKYLRAARVRIPTLAQPWSVSEFESSLERLSAIPGVEYPLDLKINYGRGEFYTYAFSPMLQSSGGDLIDRRTYHSAKGVLNGPQSVAAMTRFQSWFRKGWANPHPTDDNAFISRKAALSWVGHWSYVRYADALGDDLVLLPLPDFGRGPKTGAGSWMFAIASSCRDPAGAWALLRYTLRTDKILQWTAIHPGVPARKSALAQSALHMPGGALNLYVQQSQRGWAVLRPITPAYATITAAFAEAVDDIIKGADVHHALTKAAQKIDEDIDAHRGYQ
jgi:multiple sugar transport system substrate-binding protein